MTRGRIASICANRNGRQGLDFIRFRIAVLRRTALDDVRDVDVLPPQVDRFDDLRQQLAGPTNERLALQILVPPRRLADEHQLRVGSAYAKDEARTPAVQLAASAVTQIVTDSSQALCRGDIVRRHCIRGRRVPQRIAGPRWNNRRLGLRASRRGLDGTRMPWNSRRLGLRASRRRLDGTRTPCRIAAHPLDPELPEERQMLGELIPIEHAHALLEARARVLGTRGLLRHTEACFDTVQDDARQIPLRTSPRRVPPPRHSRASPHWCPLRTPAPGSVTSFATMRSTRLRESFVRARSTASPVSAANPTSTGLTASPRRAPSSASTSDVRRSVNARSSSDFRILAGCAPAAGV